MTSFLVEENVDIPTKFKTIDDLLSSIYSNYEFEDSNITNKYEFAEDMKNNDLNKNFISNFLKSYD